MKIQNDYTTCDLNLVDLYILNAVIPFYAIYRQGLSQSNLNAYHKISMSIYKTLITKKSFTKQIIEPIQAVLVSSALHYTVNHLDKFIHVVVHYETHQYHVHYTDKDIQTVKKDTINLYHKMHVYSQNCVASTTTPNDIKQQLKDDLKLINQGYVLQALDDIFKDVKLNPYYKNQYIPESLIGGIAMKAIFDDDFGAFNPKYHDTAFFAINFMIPCLKYEIKNHIKDSTFDGNDLKFFEFAKKLGLKYMIGKYSGHTMHISAVNATCARRLLDLINQRLDKNLDKNGNFR